jgi:hypothetical protein
MNKPKPKVEPPKETATPTPTPAPAAQTPEDVKAEPAPMQEEGKEPKEVGNMDVD